MTRRITDELVAEISYVADADPRSVIRRIAALPVRGRAGHRIDRELTRRGLGAQPLSVSPATAVATVV